MLSGCAGELPPGMHAIIARHVANQAALTGDKNLALQVLLNDPLVHDLDSAAPTLDEMLAVNQSLTQDEKGARHDKISTLGRKARPH